MLKNITKEQIRNFDKSNIKWWFKIKHNKNNIIVVDKCTIAAKINYAGLSQNSMNNNNIDNSPQQ